MIVQGKSKKGNCQFFNSEGSQSLLQYKYRKESQFYLQYYKIVLTLDILISIKHNVWINDMNWPNWDRVGLAYIYIIKDLSFHIGTST